MLTRLLCLTLTLLLPLAAQARDTKHMLPLADAMKTDAAKEQLTQGIKFYFGKQGPKFKKSLGTHTANRKTNAFGKSDEQACEWVFLSSLVALRDRALADGGDAVINIHSYYKKSPMHSDTEFECHAGAFTAGVALRGTVVKLK